MPRLIGKNLFQVRYIRLSYRIRGIVARIQINRVAKIIVLAIKVVFVITGLNPEKKTIDNRLIIKILAYSAIKIRANIPPLYSTLNPDTSSDSPSAKSKGVRFVSAKFVINQNINITEIISIGHESIFTLIRDMSIFLCRIRALIKIRDIDTSYEIVCATPRRAPSNAYFEFEHQPARNVE